MSIMHAKTTLLLMALMTSYTFTIAQQQTGYDAICSGVPWYDDKGHVVSAHGANIIRDGGRYYLFGEKHTDTSNAFAGFNCYSSTDLYNWRFESVALPVQAAGKLGPDRVGERVKVMRCPKTGEFVMYMHVDSLDYKDQFTGYATSQNITGPYQFRGPLLFNGKPIRKWDMGTFQDRDGSGYVLLHGGDIYRLSDDYKSIREQVNKAMERGFESPAIFRKDSLYYFVGSDLTSWEKNDNYYFTAPSLTGPWIKRGFFAPEGSLTWNSQTTFVLPIEGSQGTTYLFMGDRWSFPRQASAATYVWQPLTVSGYTLSIPTYREAWQINPATGMASTATTGRKIMESSDKRLVYAGTWKNDTLSVKTSGEKGAAVSMEFTGTQAGFYGLARPDGGYARVTLIDHKGNIVLSSMIDLYCKYPVSALKFLSPVLPKKKYTITISVLGERANWSDKRKADYGSTGYCVSLQKIVFRE